MSKSKYQELKKLTITLSDKATQYYYDRMYSDTKEDGCTPCSQSEMISHCLESLYDFEHEADNHLESWVDDFKKLDARAKVFAANPTQENMFWQIAAKIIIKKPSHKELVENFISIIRESFIGAGTVYTKGSCYQFYKILKFIFTDAKAYYNSDHVITEINGKYYDITGEVKKENHLLMSEHYPNSPVKDNLFVLEPLHEKQDENPDPNMGSVEAKESPINQHTNENIVQKEGLLKGLEIKGYERKLYSHEDVMNVMEEYKSLS